MTMLKRKTRSAGIAAVAAVILLSACAKSSSPSSGTTSAPSPAQGGSMTIATATVSGMGTILVDAHGSTLYYLKTEKPGTIKCTGSCAAAWPPLLLPAGTSAVAGPGVTGGDLGTIERPDGGTQVTYNGMPLYTFASDQQPGQATGQGVAGFFVITPAGSGSTAPSPASPTSSDSGYGRGY
jgi:predicted lipoprotein with Yx(FWY)xxD motif